MSQQPETQLSQTTLNEKAPLGEHIVRIPTEDGFLKSTLPRIAGVVPMAAWFIVVNEFCERFAYYGGSGVFQNYVSATGQRPGSMGHPASVATALSNFFTFFAYATPLIGAVVADAFLGKFKTILSFSVIYLAGLILLTTTSIPESHDPVTGYANYGPAAFPGYVISLLIIGTGTGGIKSVVSPFCADQIPKEPYLVTKKRRVLSFWQSIHPQRLYQRIFKKAQLSDSSVTEQFIVEPDLTVQHLYNWFYWAINVGALIGQYVCVKIERNDFWQAFIIPTCMFILSICIFISGYKRYVHVKPQGSIILESYKCIMYGIRRKSKNPTAVTPAPGTTFGFLDWSGPIPGESVEEPTKRSWTAEFPQELRQTLKACSIFPLMSIYWVCYNQMTNNLITQASQMDCHGIPNDLVGILDPVALVILIPFFDTWVYPILFRHKIEFGYIKRITAGFFLAALSMAYAAIVQKLIYNAGPNYDFANYDEDAPDAQANNNIDIYLQFPAYILIALSEIFASIGALEYSYTHAPKRMKCFVSALALLPNAVAALIGLFLAPAAANPSFTWMYTGTAIAAFVSTVLFWFLFRRYDDEDRVLKTAAVEAETHGDDAYSAAAAHKMAEADDRISNVR